MSSLHAWRSCVVPAILVVATGLWAAPDRKQEKERELTALRLRLEVSRDSLQNEIAGRWRERQRQVGQREVDKEETERLTQRLERAYTDLSAAREEGLSRERRLDELRATAAGMKVEWDQVTAQVSDLMEKRADQLADAFPLDLEADRAALEDIRRAYTKNRNVGAVLPGLFAFDRARLHRASTPAIVKQTVLPDGASEAVLLTVARFGNVFGYGIDEHGGVYGFRQTGRIGHDRYRIEPIGNEELRNAIVSAFPNWVGAGRPSGTVKLDIMQSEQSRSLVSGTRDTVGARVWRFMMAGGPVMLPLSVLPLWALVLVMLKLLQYFGVRRRNRNVAREFLAVLETHGADRALGATAGSRGMMARVARACAGKRNAGRQAAEQAAKEVLLDEYPRLGSHLNTLAVIAAVAPLLGLLGTVTGMISLFEVITRFGTGDPKLLAGGISEALITTEAGLSIAIPILLCHNYLRNRKNRIQAELQLHSVKILNCMFPEA